MFEVILDTWITGGWVMIPLAILSVVMYSMAFYLNFSIKVKSILNVTDKQIKNWILNPPESPKDVRYIFEYLEDTTDAINVDDKIKEIEIHLTNAIQKHFSILFVLVACAPLLGLLGTVTGMILTFKGISAGTAASVAISKGISEALITTETGLLVAIPGLVAAYLIKSKRAELMNFLYRVESVAIRIDPNFRNVA